jgi:hypothetical protein
LRPRRKIDGRLVEEDIEFDHSVLVEGNLSFGRRYEDGRKSKWRGDELIYKK